MSVISSVSGVSSAPAGLVEAVFAEKREIGLSFEERTTELPGQPGVEHHFLTVTGIKPAGQAALNPALHAGMVVHSIGDREVTTLVGPEGAAAIELMQQRPVVFRFWSVPAAAEEPSRAMSSRGSSVGSVAGDASNPYLQPAAQQAWQPQQLAPVPEQSQPPPLPTQQQLEQQRRQPHQPPALPSTSSYASTGGIGAIAQIDHEIGALHLTFSHATWPAGQRLPGQHDDRSAPVRPPQG
jgi:hypothetical protein